MTPNLTPARSRRTLRNVAADLETRKHRKRSGQRLTSEELRQYLEVLESGHSLQAAAAAIGRSRVTMWRLAQADPDFAAQVDDAYDAGSDTLEDTLRDIGAKGNPTAIIFLLNGRRPEKYKQVSRVEHTGANGGPIRTVTIDALDEAIAELAEQLAARSGEPVST